MVGTIVAFAVDRNSAMATVLVVEVRFVLAISRKCFQKDPVGNPPHLDGIEIVDTGNFGTVRGEPNFVGTCIAKDLAVFGGTGIPNGKGILGGLVDHRHENLTGGNSSAHFGTFDIVATVDFGSGFHRLGFAVLERIGSSRSRSRHRQDRVESVQKPLLNASTTVQESLGLLLLLLFGWKNSGAAAVEICKRRKRQPESLLRPLVHGTMGMIPQKFLETVGSLMLMLMFTFDFMVIVGFVCDTARSIPTPQLEACIGTAGRNQSMLLRHHFLTIFPRGE